MIYKPQEDSFLLQKIVKKYAHGKVLEIGVGSGIQAETAAEKEEVESVLGVDVNPEAVEHCSKNTKSEKTTFLVSDLFSEVPDENYDVIVFNPPYLPEDKDEPEDSALTTTGGKKGYELTEKFLNSVGGFLSDDGLVLLLFSSLTQKEKVEGFIHDNMLEFEEVGREKIAFEVLYVYKIKKMDLRIELESKGVSGFKALAKGHRGFIYTGMFEGKKATIKMQRPDIDAMGTVEHEANVLLELNKKGIGPQLLWSGKDYFVYKFVEGEFVLDYFDHANRQQILDVIVEVYRQMFELDKLQMNKEEMHHPVKHVLVGPGGDVVLLDFERCKKRLKLHNVTQFTQFVVSRMVKLYLVRAGIKLDKDRLLSLAKDYSEEYSEEKYKNLVEQIK